MQEQTMITASDLLECTTDIVTAYLSANTLAPGEVPGFIAQVHQTLTTVASGQTAVPMAAAVTSSARPEPAVSIKKSVMPDYIICLEDGKKLKMLKRHLKAVYNLTPEQYRERWGLPADYPMTAPNYAEKRSSLAKSIGLGQKRAGRPKKAK